MPTKAPRRAKPSTWNGEQVHLTDVSPAHTDTDISIHFAKGNVLHLGDLFFNGTYPFIDYSTGGNIGGIITAAESALGKVDDNTKIVPGHGPLGDKAALTRYRDMMVIVCERLRKMKTAVDTLEQAVAKKPTADLDAQWGKGFMPLDVFVTVVYNTL